MKTTIQEVEGCNILRLAFLMVLFLVSNFQFSCLWKPILWTIFSAAGCFRRRLKKGMVD